MLSDKIGLQEGLLSMILYYFHFLGLNEGGRLRHRPNPEREKHLITEGDVRSI